MAVFKGQYYRPPAEHWDTARCEREVKKISTDAAGTPYPWPGYVGCSTVQGYGKTRYNGGCNRVGSWWEGEIRDLPEVADGFTLVHIISWGWRIVRVRSTSEVFIDDLAVGDVFRHAGVTWQLRYKSSDSEVLGCLCVAADGVFGKNFYPGHKYYFQSGIKVQRLELAADERRQQKKERQCISK